MIRISPAISIPDREIWETFVRASGPGGQNVNKVSTAVQLRFDVLHSPSLPADVKQRLVRLAGKRITEEGILLIDARRFRTQERNRQDARDRLTELVRSALRKPRVRRPTKPSAASKQRRMDEKHQRSEVKRTRKKGAGIE